MPCILWRYIGKCLFTPVGSKLGSFRDFFTHNFVEKESQHTTLQVFLAFRNTGLLHRKDNWNVFIEERTR